MKTTCTLASVVAATKISMGRHLVNSARHKVKTNENSRMNAKRHTWLGMYARAKIAEVGSNEAIAIVKTPVMRASSSSGYS